MQTVHPIALFRLSVLGPLACRDKFERGELTQLIQAISEKPFNIPGSANTFISKKTIEGWYRRWRKGGIDALAPKPRSDRGKTKLSPTLQEKILSVKTGNPARSISTIKAILEGTGEVAKGELTRSSIHRLLRQHGLSAPPKEKISIERRSYEATYAGDLWVGDVMHGPTINFDGKKRKVYLVSLMDDASRLLTHSAFCLSETALDIEGVLKQAVLKRGLCKKLIVDNGAAYRASTFQALCARLEIQLIYSRPYEPQSKGKIERFHALFRRQFLSELQHEQITQLCDLNARLWAWIDQVYHARVHGALDNQSPLQRYQQDLAHIRPLLISAGQFEKLFHHYLKRKVRKDGSIAYEGERYEVSYLYSGENVVLVVNPHRQLPLYVQTLGGQYIGPVTPLDYQANANRHRHRPNDNDETHGELASAQYSAVEHALKKQTGALIPSAEKTSPKK